jgi:hypothetical protein
VSYAVKPIHWQHHATGICNTQSAKHKQTYHLCVFIFLHKKWCILWNSIFRHQVEPLYFLDHAHNCQCISQQQNTEHHLHLCDININVSVDDLRDIFPFCQFNAINTLFHKLHTNSCLQYVIYDVINIFHGKTCLACKKK